MPTIEAKLNGQVVLKGYPVEPMTPERFEEIFRAVQALWPGAIVQYEKEPK